MRNMLMQFDNIMLEHGLTIPQTYTILCMANSLPATPTAEMYQVFISKNLLKADGVNTKVLYRTMQEVEQQELPLAVITEPKGDEISLEAAHKVEQILVPEKHRTDEAIQVIADKYFKGDIGVARYYNIFKWCFPTKSHPLYYNVFKCDPIDGNRWDSSVSVAKKFHKLFLKLDIGAFFQGLYMFNISVVDRESSVSYMCKPNKYLLQQDQWYEYGLQALDTVRVGREQKQAQQTQLNFNNESQQVPKATRWNPLQP